MKMKKVLAVLMLWCMTIAMVGNPVICAQADVETEGSYIDIYVHGYNTPITDSDSLYYALSVSAQEGYRTLKEAINPQLPFTDEPTREDALFEGWIEFKIEEMIEEEWGDTYEQYTMVSKTLYTAEEFLSKPIPTYDTAYVAKWSDVPWEVYEEGITNGYPKAYVYFDGQSGEFGYDYGDGFAEITEYASLFALRYNDLEASDVGLIGDPVFWNPEVKFLGWMACTMGEFDYEQIPGTKIMSTSEVFNYKLTEKETYFVAQWDKDVNEYYTFVDFNLGESYMMFLDKDGDVIYANICMAYLKCGEGTETIGSQFEQMGRRIVSDPMRDDAVDAVFEGWIECKYDYENEILEVLSEKYYTTEEVLEKHVPAGYGRRYKLMYTAKWSDIPIEDYFKEQPILARIYGKTRIETSFKLAEAYFNYYDKELDSVIITSGFQFADALAGSYLASVKNAPILLADGTQATNDKIKEYVQKYLSPNGTIYILGGSNAVPTTVEDTLQGFNVKRLGGANRFETNLLILEEAGVGDEDILVCTGMNFADSLSGSATERPILLVGDYLLDEQKSFLEKLSGNQLYILGGTSAVSDTLEKEISKYGDVKRLGGRSRFETSIMIAEEFFEEPYGATFAYALNFPDGLCGGPLATTVEGPLILTATGYEEAATKYVAEHKMEVGYFIGGTGLISDDAARIIFGQDENTTVINYEELN